MSARYTRSPLVLDAIPYRFQEVFEIDYHSEEDCKVCQKVGFNSTELASVLSNPWKRNFLPSFIKLSIRLILFASSCFGQSEKSHFNHGWLKTFYWIHRSQDIFPKRSFPNPWVKPIEKNSQTLKWSELSWINWWEPEALVSVQI